MTSKWNGEKGIQLSGGVLEELIKEHGAQAKLAEVLEKIKKEGKKE